MCGHKKGSERKGKCPDLIEVVLSNAFGFFLVDSDEAPECKDELEGIEKGDEQQGRGTVPGEGLGFRSRG